VHVEENFDNSFMSGSFIPGGTCFSLQPTQSPTWWVPKFLSHEWQEWSHLHASI